jgi:hypothetical protein
MTTRQVEATERPAEGGQSEQSAERPRLKWVMGETAGWRALLSGGNLNNGVNAGCAYRNANNTAGNRNENIGGRSATCDMVIIVGTWPP